MTPTIGVATAAVPGQELASQSLFEHMARQAQGMPQGTSPGQLSEGVLNNLDGYLNRARQFADKANDFSARPSPLALDGQTAASVKDPAPTLQEKHLEQVVGSLSMMFDHAIETQMVVRGATQISGAANTLLRGQ
ncbi:hypothetical protein [Pseudomonas sp. LRF_L74]|uniref:hypothetical protein n=1 Tax=Pseudomonas sp. LRF_L74 TaxID=3369422 RepID=UPI003F5FEEF9